MPHGEISEIIPASSDRVFKLLHDYDRRLEWDTLLREAYLEPGHSAAAKDAVSVCKGRWMVGGIAMRTVYVSYDPPNVAAVKMLNRPPLFESWAASIRHESVSDGASRVTYKYTFTTRPRFLRFLLDPILSRLFRWETARRLRSLKRYFEQ